ncbi:hypothetical protein QR680_004055 [Steinernema hermaphroditum]|uniref:Uncharacterized protein n=1 Tax=Steinernema hermaphroditum TaxID=289476 RepID=A0AA39HPR3_9BILA|nr:hypothetical protein QR680_004055 [Steinernema hermaphroditum]
MWRPAYIAQYFIIIVVSIANIGLVFILQQRASLKAQCKGNNYLAVFFIAILLVSLSYLQYSIVWLVFTFNLVGDFPFSGELFMTSGNLTTSLRVFYDAVTIMMLCHRIVSIRVPLFKCKLNFFTVLFVPAIISLLLFITLIYDGVNVIAIRSATSSSKDCMQNLVQKCSAITTIYNQFFFLSRLISSILVVGFGLIFHLFYRQYKKQLMVIRKSKVNEFVISVFYLRVILEVIPFACDNILRRTADVNLSEYIGAYGALGGTLDVFFCICAYFIPMLRKMKNKAASRRISTVNGW